MYDFPTIFSRCLAKYHCVNDSAQNYIAGSLDAGQLVEEIKRGGVHVRAEDGLLYGFSIVHHLSETSGSFSGDITALLSSIYRDSGLTPVNRDKVSARYEIISNELLSFFIKHSLRDMSHTSLDVSLGKMIQNMNQCIGPLVPSDAPSEQSGGDSQMALPQDHRMADALGGALSKLISMQNQLPRLKQSIGQCVTGNMDAVSMIRAVKEVGEFSVFPDSVLINQVISSKADLFLGKNTLIQSSAFLFNGKSKESRIVLDLTEELNQYGASLPESMRTQWSAQIDHSKIMIKYIVSAKMSGSSVSPPVIGGGSPSRASFLLFGEIRGANKNPVVPKPPGQPSIHTGS